MDLIKKVLFIVSFWGCLFYIANIFRFTHIIARSLFCKNIDDYTFISRLKNSLKRDIDIRFLKDPTFSKKLIIVATLGVLNLFLNFYFQNEIIGSYFEKEYYSTKYYINLYPDKGNTKNYSLKADIQAEYRDVSMTYCMGKIYFPNGGYLTFDNMINSKDHPLKLNEKVLVQDDNAKYWYVELTSRKVE